MSKSKHARLISELGNQMAESAGRQAVDDRYAGFTPNDSATGSMALDRIAEDVDQPRKTYDEESLREFAEHLKTHGVQQPIQLRWNESLDKWLIVFGHRRYRAAKLAGLASIPCTFADEDLDESTIRVRQLVENCQREDLAPMEMSRAIAALSELTQWSNRRIARELGFNPATIGRYLGLLEIPEDLQQRVDQGELAPSVAIDVLRIKDQAKRKSVGKEIADQRLTRSQAKERITAELSPTPEKRSAPVEKQLLSQTLNVAVYRNPQVSDAIIYNELMRITSQLDPEKAET